MIIFKNKVKMKLEQCNYVTKEFRKLQEFSVICNPAKFLCESSRLTVMFSNKLRAKLNIN